MERSQGRGLTRRDLLKGAGMLTVAFAIPRAVFATAAGAAESLAPGVDPAQLDSWLAVAADGSVTVFTDKLEIGMGVITALAQIVAEELDVPIETIRFVLGDTARTPDQRGAGGSTSLAQGARPLRNAAAEARRVLLDLAAARLGVPADRLTVRDGIVGATGDPSKRVSYGDLIGGRRFDVALKASGEGASLNVTGRAQPKRPDQYTIVGKPVKRIDIPDKVTGRFTYVVDVRVPGMLHGRVIRPPVAGATLLGVDGAQALPGVVKVVAKKNFLGVVAETEWQAIQAARALKVTWSTPGPAFPAMEDLYVLMGRLPVQSRKVFADVGNVDAAMASAARVIAARYAWPFQSHAMMGPACAVADVQNGQATVWSGTQKPHQLQQGLAELLGLPVNKVRVIWVEGAGSYGRSAADDVPADAALLSQAVGRPVRVQWMRADETGWDPKGPPVVMDVRAGLDAHGTVVALDYVARDFSGSGIPAGTTRAGNMLAGQLLGLPAGGFDEPGNLQESYAFPNKRKVGEVLPWRQEASPLRTAHLRAPEQLSTTFGGESFVDEVAAALSVDPVEFRLRYLSDPRDIAVVKAAAERAGWQRRPSPRTDAPRAGLATGRGIAYSPRGETHLATIAEVEVSQATGQVHVTRLVIAHDCGLIINPDGLKGTIEANLIQSTSRALNEEVQFSRSAVTSVDWRTYPILMAPEAPREIDIVLINRPDRPPAGAGEPASVATAAAIANAIFDATGARLRTVPFTSARMLEGLRHRG